MRAGFYIDRAKFPISDARRGADMMRILSILFAGWVVNRVMIENGIRRPVALLPSPDRKRQGRPQRSAERHPQ
jgi:hypothetical protein